MMHYVVRGSGHVFDSLADVGAVTRPQYRLTSWNPRKSVVQTRTLPLLLDYAFVHALAWVDLVDVMRRRGIYLSRLSDADNEPVFVQDDVVMDLVVRAGCGEYDVDRSRPKPRPQSTQFERLVKIPVGGEAVVSISDSDVLCVVEESGGNRVVVRPVGSTFKVIVK